MKSCSKCKRQLDESCFVKSEAYSDGLYPLCKECRKAIRLKSLADQSLCARCKTKPHLPYVTYCMECFRVAKGRPVPTKTVDRTNKSFCSRCKEIARLPYHNYCQKCKNASTRAWLAKKRGVRLPNEKRRKKSARHYINTLYRRGKIKREPCKHCGKPSSDFHHLDYKDRTTNIEHVCFPCHVRLEREKRKLTNRTS